MAILIAKAIQTKCPSKYKDDMKAAEKNIQNGRSDELIE